MPIYLAGYGGRVEKRSFLGVNEVDSNDKLTKSMQCFSEVGERVGLRSEG